MLPNGPNIGNDKHDSSSSSSSTPKKRYTHTQFNRFGGTQLFSPVAFSSLTRNRATNSRSTDGLIKCPPPCPAPCVLCPPHQNVITVTQSSCSRKGERRVIDEHSSACAAAECRHKKTTMKKMRIFFCAVCISLRVYRCVFCVCVSSDQHTFKS